MSNPLIEGLITAGDQLARALADVHAFTAFERALALEDWQRAVMRVAATNTDDRREGRGDMEADR